MDDRVTRLESAVALLTSDVARLRDRLETLEARGLALQDASAAPLTALPELRAATVQNWLALVGRTLLVLGGAYLLRALTAAEILPVTIGVGLGLLYGAPWLLLASRAGARGERLDAFCHGLATALIGYPLVWEATVRFQVITPEQSAVLLAALTAGALLLSAARRLHSLAAIVTCGAIGSAMGLGVATGNWFGYTMLAIALGLATLWLGYLRGWVLLRWPAALACNLMIVVLTGHPGGAPGLVIPAQLFALVGYLGSFALRTLSPPRPVIPFEAVQSAGVIVFALGSLFSFVQGSREALMLVSACSVLVGAATYVVTFKYVDGVAPRTNAFYYSLLALVLTMVGITMGLPSIAAFAYAVLGFAAALGGHRRAPLVLSVQSTALLVAAIIVSGLLTAATAAMVAPVSAWRSPDFSAAVALLVTAVTIGMPVGRSANNWPLAARLPRFVLVSFLVWTAAGIVVMIVSTGLPSRFAQDAAWVATLRTTLLVVATLTVAAAARAEGGREAGWLTYPLLVVTGIKLVVSDFPQGRPVTLFLALALYGTALIAAPRLLRRAESVAAPSSDRPAPDPHSAIGAALHH